jgi:hypothetical protein
MPKLHPPPPPGSLYSVRHLNDYTCSDLPWPIYKPPKNVLKRARWCMHKCDGKFVGFGGGPGMDDYGKLNICRPESQ